MKYIPPLSINKRMAWFLLDVWYKYQARDISKLPKIFWWILNNCYFSSLCLEIMLFPIACFQPHDEAAIFVPQTIENSCFNVLRKKKIPSVLKLFFRTQKWLLWHQGKTKETNFSDSFSRPKKSASLLKEGLWSMMMKWLKLMFLLRVDWLSKDMKG